MRQPGRGVDTQWVQYDWSKPVTTYKVNVYWWMDRGGVAAPASYRVLYWNGKDFRSGRERCRVGSCGRRVQHHHLR